MTGTPAVLITTPVLADFCAARSEAGSQALH
jgi:hypothetical protein